MDSDSSSHSQAPFDGRVDGPGPFRVKDLAPGSRYELSNGHLVYCAPTGGEGSRGTVASAEVLDTDPAVTEAGIDAGFTPAEGVLRAPDVAVGNVPDQPGWIPGVPALALEYAGSGQDEKKLQEKIADLLKGGTRWVWVVRLVGPRRVEVHSAGEPVRLFGPGEELRAPGILQNAVLVEALFDRRVAHEATLRNLLQRKGYESLEAVREEAREEAREEGREEIILQSIAHQFERRLTRPLTDAERSRLIQRVREEGAKQVSDVVLDFTPEELGLWLAPTSESAG
jgi:Uma2 family endonuclease